MALVLLPRRVKGLHAWWKNYWIFPNLFQGRIKLEYESVNLTELIEHIRKQLTPRAIRENIQFTVIYPENLSEMWADANRLKQLFINILDNALKFTAAGGAICFQAEEREKGIYFLPLRTAVVV